MAKLTQSNSKQWETQQVTANQLATETPGGMAPSKEDIVRAANARAQRRHNVKPANLADIEVLPDSNELLGDERVGIRNNGYLVKKNLEFGANAMYNSLPPGMDIEDQENCDIRKMDLVVYDTGLGYPGDGWTPRRQPGRQMPRVADRGRPSETNYMGAREKDVPSTE